MLKMCKYKPDNSKMTFEQALLTEGGCLLKKGEGLRGCKGLFHLPIIELN